ncbi:MAG: Ribosomal protein [Chlamydiia bacterium]|nr:Ribosomal protein [Chlamydiia bacterium]
MTKPNGLREKTDEELNVLEINLRKEIFQFRNALANKDKEAKPHLIRERRKDIARIRTIHGQRKRQPKSQG